MRHAAFTVFFMLGSLVTLVGNEATTFLIPQPIISFGDTENWTTTGKPDTEEMYLILDMPYFEKHDNGQIYDPIASPHLMANSDTDGGSLRDCNLLSLYGIEINNRPLDSKDVFLDLTHAKAKKNSVITVEIAAYAALECIRMVANRSSGEITLRIRPPKDEVEKWIEVERVFNKHDKTKPFKRPQTAKPRKPSD